MSEQYVTIRGRKLRRGYTTGSCAAAASKAAAVMLFSGKPLNTVTIDTPAGVKLNLDIKDVEFSIDRVKCSVVKDGGDDPDVTHGLRIFAEAKFAVRPGINIIAGEGIGRVTLPGLKVGVGQPAINPVPMGMIKKEVSEVIKSDKGIDIILSIPGGREAAERTLNPRLGIVGGISILGTTGIVSPMSEEAWRESIALELSIAAAKGYKSIVFTFGNYGEEFVRSKLRISNNYIIKISNFVGFMLEKAVENCMHEVLLVGHIGKIAKVAAGIFNTHSRVADARMEILSSYAAIEGASTDVVCKIYSCTTTEAVVGVIDKYNLRMIYDRIAVNVSKRCREYSFNKLEVGTVLFDGENSLLAIDENGRNIIRRFRQECIDGK